MQRTAWLNEGANRFTAEAWEKTYMAYGDRDVLIEAKLSGQYYLVTVMR